MGLIYAELGAVVNAIAVLIGGGIGCFLKRGIPERIGRAISSALALAAIFLGVTGMANGENPLIAVLSLTVGAVIGEAIDIDRHVCRLGDFLQEKLGAKSGFAEGFISCTFISCIGALALTGAFHSALGNHTTLSSKALIDGITAFLLATSLGVGCVLSAFPLLLYEGGLIALFYFVGAALPASMVNEISAIGSILILVIGTNMLGITKIKLANLLPAMFLPLLFCLIPFDSFM